MAKASPGRIEQAPPGRAGKAALKLKPGRGEAAEQRGGRIRPALGKPAPKGAARRGASPEGGKAAPGAVKRGVRPSQASARVVMPAAALAAPPLVLLHRDEAVLVINKPAGLAVAPGLRGGPSLEDLLPALQLGKKRAPQPAHRLDQDTAGCLVLGRSKPALAALGAIFAESRARKTYWAVVRGGPRGDAGVVEAPLLKVSTKATGWRMVVDPKGQPAATEWRVLGRGGGMSWLELRPRTGRTHQIRVHCAHLGHPILGDARYGGGGGALHLLARAIALPLEPPVLATAPVPPHMRAAMTTCGWVGA